MPRELQPCGTVAAYQRHIRAGEEACRECLEARAAYSHGRYTPAPRQLDPCGTPGAYQRHLRHGEETCQLCRAAFAAYSNAHASGPRRHGTNGCYRQHLQAGQVPCDACRQAHLKYQREYLARRAEARARSNALDQMLAEAWAEVTAS